MTLLSRPMCTLWWTMETSWEPFVIVTLSRRQRLWWLVANVILMPSAEGHEKMSVMISRSELICTVQLICCACGEPGVRHPSARLKSQWARHHISPQSVLDLCLLWTRCSFLLLGNKKFNMITVIALTSCLGCKDISLNTPSRSLQTIQFKTLYCIFRLILYFVYLSQLKGHSTDFTTSSITVCHRVHLG